MSNINNKEIIKLANLLGLEAAGLDFKDSDEVNTALSIVKKYIENMNSSEFILLYDVFKKKEGISGAIKYLNLVAELAKFKITDDIAEELLSDNELERKIASIPEEKSNNLVRILKKNIDYTIEDDPDVGIDLVEIDDAESEQRSIQEEFDDAFNLIQLPEIYDIEEEKGSFRKYQWLLDHIKHYLYVHKCLDFVRYIKELDENPTGKRGLKTKFDIHNALCKLYSETCNDEVVVKLKQDKNFNKLIEEAKSVRDEIALHNYRLVKSVAKAYIHRGLPLKDLMQEGNQGLIKSIDKYDLNRGTKFGTYAVWWIRQAITRALSNEGTTIRIPVHLYERMLRINKIIRIIRTEEDIDEPSPQKIYEKSKELGFKYTYEQIVEGVKARFIANPVSTDKKVGEEEDSSLIDFLSDDNVDSTSYAEVSNNVDIKNTYLKNISEGKTIYGKVLKKSNETLKFKDIKFYTISGNVIEIFLTTNEDDKEKKEEKQFEYYIGRIREEGGRERFLELLNKYGINPNILTAKYEISDYVISHSKREELVYRMRTGFHSAESKKIIQCRDRNRALGFDPKKDILTLEDSGRVFGITRERIRQIENKVLRKMNEAKPKEGKAQIFQNLYLGEANENIFDLFNVVSRVEWVLTVPNNSVIKVDGDFNITPVSLGNVTISIRNIRTGYIRKLDIRVLPSRKDSFKEYIRNKQYVLSFKPNEKDSQ